MKDEARKKRDADHLWHVWLNRYNQVGDAGFDHSMYEFKSMMDFLRYGPIQMEKAFTGKLTQIHQQCSQSTPVEIKENKLKCALGKDVRECGILKSLRSVFDENKDHYDVGVEIYRIMANTCAWHIFTEQMRGQFIDTSEGWVMDESDRMFWQNVYQNLSYQDDGVEK